MKSILQSKKVCYLTNRTDNLHRHHIYYGTGNRQVSEDKGFWVWLIAEAHNVTKDSVHQNRTMDYILKKRCQEKFEELGHSREEFMRLIGRNYLD